MLGEKLKENILVTAKLCLQQNICSYFNKLEEGCSLNMLYSKIKFVYLCIYIIEHKGDLTKTELDIVYTKLVECCELVVTPPSDVVIPPDVRVSPCESPDLYVECDYVEPDYVE